MDLSSLIQINISLATVTPSRANFGTPLCLGYHTKFNENYRDYTSLNGMLSDGFTVNDQTYKLAASVFSQNPRPATVKVGRLPAPATAHTSILDLNSMFTGSSVQFTLVSPEGVELDVDVPYNTSAAATAGVVAALSSSVMSASGDTVVFTAPSNGPRLFVKDITGFGDFTDTTGDWGYDTQLGVILNETSDFYGVFIDVNSPTNIADVAAWTLSNNRLFGASPQVTNPADYTATANALKSASNDRVYSLVTKNDPEAYGAAGLASLMFTKDPGSENWAFKTVRGLSADNWTASNLVTFATDNSNTYTTTNGVSFSYSGVLHSGEWIDVRRGIDWFEARLAERLLALQLNNDKIPYTDAGISMVANELRGQLAEAVTKGLFDEGWTVTIPKASAATTANKGIRKLVDVEFSATLQGAINTITITGKVSV